MKTVVVALISFLSFSTFANPKRADNIDLISKVLQIDISYAAKVLKMLPNEEVDATILKNISECAVHIQNVKYNDSAFGPRTFYREFAIQECVQSGSYLNVNEFGQCTTALHGYTVKMMVPVTKMVVKDKFFGLYQSEEFEDGTSILDINLVKAPHVVEFCKFYQNKMAAEQLITCMDSLERDGLSDFKSTKGYQTSLAFFMCQNVSYMEAISCIKSYKNIGFDRSAAEKECGVELTF